ncbi:MAG: hypothetical protein AB1589_11845 [Cyanobacteriota bacterium]
MFTQLNNPFSGLPQEVVAEILVEAGRSHEKEFKESLEKLLEKISSVEVLHLISLLAVYGLFVGMTETGKTSKKKSPTIHQAHVELVQALALRSAFSEQPSEPIQPHRDAIPYEIIGLANDMPQLLLRIAGESALVFQAAQFYRFTFLI